ncbi:hypothetical protein BGZ63DRAFT_137232 [Mariannaea sp. PMI_226]|nr:hypothetical protein BGZ63DRAFT_137232 [Mariannaea sp. PMI_226]
MRQNRRLEFILSTFEVILLYTCSAVTQMSTSVELQISDFFVTSLCVASPTFCYCIGIGLRNAKTQVLWLGWFTPSYNNVSHAAIFVQYVNYAQVVHLLQPRLNICNPPISRSMRSTNNSPFGASISIQLQNEQNLVIQLNRFMCQLARLCHRFPTHIQQGDVTRRCDWVASLYVQRQYHRCD